VEHVGRSELVVLPYRFMHNSGGALAALSLGRPVLVPSNDVNLALGAEVGAQWVHTFQGPITGQDIRTALKRIREARPEHPPDLSGRGWDLVGRLHVQAFRRAIALTRDG
jgi:hypothetical protein